MDQLDRKNRSKMSNKENELKKTAEWLEKKKLELEKRLCKPLKGEIVVKKSKNIYYKYYLKDGERILLKKDDMEMAIPLIQQEYDIKVYKRICLMIKNIKSYTDCLDIGAIDSVYQKMSPAKQRYVRPVIKPIEEYIEEWRMNNPGQQNSFPITTNLYSIKKEHVRSKSEKMIADLFYRMDIPYIYEPRIVFDDGKNHYPDFLLLNKRTRKMFYYEHFGKVDEADYALNNWEKLENYSRNGYILGVNLLCTTETRTEEVDERIVQKIIEEFLL